MTDKVPDTPSALLRGCSFSHSYKDIQEKLLPLVKEKIANALRGKGLSDVSLDVILVPATLENIDFTFNHPESSTTNTWEWTSTTFIDDTGKEAGRSLIAGDSVGGGAAYVSVDSFANFGGHLGARLAVVLHATEH